MTAKTIPVVTISSTPTEQEVHLIQRTVRLSTDSDGNVTVQWPGDEDVYIFAR